MPHNGFTDEQTKRLEGMLSPDRVKIRQGFSYITAWDATQTANDIFGFGAWDRETLDVRMIQDEVDASNKHRVGYTCRVRISVRAGDTVVFRDGTGAGQGINKDVFQAHELAVKEAESDAMKRALSQFGNQFGLALYDKEQTNVGYDAPAPSEEMTRLSDDVAAINDKPALTEWMSANKDAIGKLVEFEREALKRMCTAKLSGFQRAAANG